MDLSAPPGSILSWLAELGTRPERPGPYALDVERELLRRLEDPQLDFPAVHVAGTRGKGSTCALVTASLEAAGHVVGRTTSPHLLSPTERIHVRGRDITTGELEALGTHVRPVAEELDASYFEVLIAMAFLAFQQAGVDVAVVEVGLGGRLDATNLVVPAVTAITRLGLDHADRLGPTRADIAREKAGILKAGVPVVVAPGHPEALDVVRRRAEEVGAPLRLVTPADVAAAPRTVLPGAAQRENAAVAWALVEELGRATGGRLAVSRAAAEAGFASVSWPARLELVGGDDVRFLLDVAHDVTGVETLAQHVASLGAAAALVFSCLAEKDLDGIVGVLAGSAAMRRAPTFVPELPGRRARPAAEVAAALQRVGMSASVHADVARACAAAVGHVADSAGGERRDPPLVVVFGSFVLVEAWLRATHRGL